MRRREFLRLLALQAAAWSVGCARGSSDREEARAAAEWPPNPWLGRWMGDDFRAGHQLRDGTLTLDPAERAAGVDVVVVGGGVSGLATALLLADRGAKVRVLEQAATPGGNAKSAAWGDVTYSIGAAYFAAPDPESRLAELYRRIGIEGTKIPKGEVLHDGHLRHGFWDGATHPDAAGDIARIRDAWTQLLERRYPAIPWDSESWTKRELERADRMPFDRLLEELRAPSVLRRFCEHYCWSSFGGGTAEISSYAALNFLTAEFGEIRALPGGNAAIAEGLHRELEAKGGEVVTGALAGRVRRRDRGVEVTAVSARGATLHPARVAVVAVPRFIAARIVEGFPAERSAAVRTMEWRAYLVANVLLTRRPAVDWYDAYRVDEIDPRDCGWTDLILADHVAVTRGPMSVLTAYRALPYPGGRNELLADQDFARHRDRVLRDLRPWLPALGLRESDVVDVNLARWGHPLVLAKPGQLTSGVLERVSAPFGPIVFAQQDRFGVPAIEAALEAAFAATEEASNRI